MKKAIVSVFDNIKSIKPKFNSTLFSMCTSDECREELLLLRHLEKGSEDYTTIKQTLTCFTPSITCMQRGAKYMTAHSGFVCLDWDNIENPKELKDRLKKEPFISFCALSCSGLGVYAIVRIEKPNLHRQHYEALLDYFTKLGLPADPACKDLARLRIVSNDPNYYYNEEATTWSNVKLPKPQPTKTMPYQYHGTNINERAVYAVRDYVVANEVDITSGRNYWVSLGTYIAQTLGESTGKNVFVDISRFHPRFDEMECSKVYNTASQYSNITNIGILLNACKRSGVPDLTKLLTLNKEGGTR